MVDVIRKPIRSRHTIDEPRPWFEIDINDDGILVTSGNCGCEERPQTERFPMNQEIAAARTIIDVETGEPCDSCTNAWVFGLDLDGVYQLLPQAELNVDWLAHLAWYYPDTDSWLCLEFIDES